MKNIHVLTTDKPSNIVISSFDSKLKLNNNTNYSVEYSGRNQNIYITSDEEIKEGDWFAVELFKITGESRGLHIEKCIKLNDIWCNDFDVVSTRHKGNCNKIILTTDQDLIKDGVQSIDDEFLEWFVENPNCEEVEIVDDWNSPRIDAYEYKIIIPKEEAFKHKIEVLSKEEILSNRSNAYDFIDFDKQETLEELKKWKEEALIAHEINQKVIKKLMDEKSEQIDSEKKNR